MTTDCILPYNNAGLISKVSEKIAIENAKNCRFQQSHCRLTPLCGETSANIPTNLIPPEIRVIGLHYCRWYYGSIFMQIFVVGSERRIFSATECVSVVQGHRRSLIFALIERAYATSYYWLIVTLLLINSNFGPILHRFWDTATYWLKIFPTPLSSLI